MKKIDAVKIVRNIRDEHHKETLGKSPTEVIAYFRKKAQKIRKITEEELIHR